jgi:hypothetical protein
MFGVIDAPESAFVERAWFEMEPTDRSESLNS